MGFVCNAEWRRWWWPLHSISEHFKTCDRNVINDWSLTNCKWKSHSQIESFFHRLKAILVRFPGPTWMHDEKWTKKNNNNNNLVDSRRNPGNEFEFSERNSTKRKWNEKKKNNRKNTRINGKWAHNLNRCKCTQSLKYWPLKYPLNESNA